jgi:glucose-1-phosphate thymidylyltransferase
MPDTLIRPRSAHQRLLAEHARAGADVSLGVFPTDQPQRFGMVDIDEHGRVVGNVDKPATTSLRYMWGFACWSPGFGALMADYLREVTAPPSEVVLSSVFQRAVERGLRVMAVKFDDGEYIDIGTASSLKQSLHRFIDD